LASQDSSPGWRASTWRHIRAGVSQKTSSGSASTTIQAPLRSSPSNWPADQPE
jgi:hypothetical protein